MTASSRPCATHEDVGHARQNGSIAAPAANSYFKAFRSDDAWELLETNKNAFVLLWVIAGRAQRTARFNRFNLKPGQALIGDFKRYGMTEKQYRIAKETLEKFNFAAFEGATKGTIATLISTSIFDVNLDYMGEQQGVVGADKGRTRGGQGATTKNAKEGENANNANKNAGGAPPSQAEKQQTERDEMRPASRPTRKRKRSSRLTVGSSRPTAAELRTYKGMIGYP